MKYLIAFLLLFNSAYFFGQTLQPFVEEVSDEYPRFNDMVFDADGNMYAGCNYTKYDKMAIIKYDINGDYVDSIFIGIEYENIRVLLMEIENDTIFIYSQLIVDNVENQLLVTTLNNDLEVIWQHLIRIGDYTGVQRFRAFEFKNYKYLHLSSYTSYFIRLDKNYNLDSVFHVNEILKNSEPIFYTDSGFVYPNNYGARFIYHFNEDLQVTWSDTVSDNIFHWLFSGIQRLPNGNYLVGGDLDTPNKISFVSDTFAFMHKYAQFGDEDNDRFTISRTFAPNYDTSIVYASGYENMKIGYWVPMGYNEPNAIWVAKFDNDTLLWHNYYQDSNYYITTNIKVGPDDAVYVSATKYDAVNQPDYRSSVIFRIEPDGTLPVGILNNPERTFISIYPNPGTNQLHIETGNRTGVFSMYNLSGQIILSHEFTGNTILNTESLIQGIYFYRFVNSKGEVARGKWIKE